VAVAVAVVPVVPVVGVTASNDVEDRRGGEGIAEIRGNHFQRNRVLAGAKFADHRPPCVRREGYGPRGDAVEIVVMQLHRSLRREQFKPSPDEVDGTAVVDRDVELVDGLVSGHGLRELCFFRRGERRVQLGEDAAPEEEQPRGLRFARFAGARAASRETPACRGMKMMLGGLLSGSDFTVG
jgi:hypothetical protein